MASIAEKLSPSHLAKVQGDRSLLVLPSEHTESASSMGFAVSFSQEYVVVSFESKHGRYMGLSENRVPKKSQWLMIIIPHFQTNPYGDIPFSFANDD